MENFNKNLTFTTYLDELIKNYFIIKKIIIVATTDVLKKKFLNFFLQDQLILDTIKMLHKFNYDFEILLDSNFINQVQDEKAIE
jgi:rRNA-processing protein FCF1